MLVNNSASPYVKLKNVPIDAVRWTRGFWHEQFERCHTVMVPNMWRLLKDSAISHAYTNFLIAAGDEEGSHSGPQWHDGDLYKWLEATAAVYAITRDEPLDQLMDEVIQVISQVQREDGYIHTPVLIKQRQGRPDARPLQQRLDFETYNMGHLMTAACIHYRATGKQALLDVAKKAADWLYRYYQEATPELARNAICPSHYMGVIELYRTTGDPRYLELGKNLIEIRDLVTDGGDDNQDRLPFRQQTRAVGHAVRANYLYAGVADVYAETGDRSLLDNLELLWANVVQQKMYITGGCGALYDGASPDGSPQQEVITRVHQAYGREYQLPNTTAHNETCASVALVLWNWRMLAITGEARFADILELALYNGALAAIGLDGASFFYNNPLRRADNLPFELRWSRTRQPYISCFCCPPNIVRTIAEAGNYAYSVSDEGVWVNLYGSNVLKTSLPGGAPLTLVQETDYPWSGTIRLVVEEAAELSFALMLRIPGWAQGATIAVNGQPAVESAQPGQYATLQRVWSTGDAVELVLPLQARLIEAHPLVEETRNHVAVTRGPLVYCLEAVDLPHDVRLSDVLIPRDIQLTPEHATSFGDRKSGLIALVGVARALHGQEAWHNQLYRELRPLPHKEIAIRLIPYYAWDNRGPGDMSVWLPLAQ